MTSISYLGLHEGISDGLLLIYREAVMVTKAAIIPLAGVLLFRSTTCSKPLGADNTYNHHIKTLLAQEPKTLSSTGYEPPLIPFALLFKPKSLTAPLLPFHQTQNPFKTINLTVEDILKTRGIFYGDGC